MLKVIKISSLQINGTSVQDLITELYYKSGSLRYWRGVRYCSSLLRKTVDSISPFITTVLVNGKQVNFCCTSIKIVHVILFDLK